MRALIIGGGIGGLAAALTFHAAGIHCTIFEQVRELRELGVGINALPHAIKDLAQLGLLPALDQAGIRTRELIYANRFGQEVWRESRGLEAGHDTPQFSIHRGKLHGVLLEAVRNRLGPDAIRTGCRLLDFTEHANHVEARFEQRDGAETFTETGDLLVGADGIHSTVRAKLYPTEGPPVWNGTMLWRGATDWPVWQDGRTMIIAGGMGAKFVFYPIHHDPARPDHRLTNWAVMIRIAEGDVGAPPRREDWNRPGLWDELAPIVQTNFHLDFVSPLALIEASGTFYEYPVCDRDPLPRWSFGRTTLLGDAAHAMYPVGSNGASQAILDATALARHLQAGTITQALAAYDAERRPMTSDIVAANRRGGPERVIDVVEERSPDGFTDINAVASYAEREAIVRGYASMAGYTKEQVNRPS